jgi:hypothetical protein
MSRRAIYLVKIKFNKGKLFLPLLNLARLPLLLGLAFLLTFFLATGNVTAERLFQSPQSPPPAQPAPPQPDAAQPPPAQPAPPQPDTAQPAPQEQPAPVPQPATSEQPAPAQPPANPQPAVSQPVSPLTLPPLPAPAKVADTAKNLGETDEPAPNLTLDQAELIDTVVVTGAFIWFCCGVILLPVIPLGFLLLYIRGRRKILEEEGF